MKWSFRRCNWALAILVAIFVSSLALTKVEAGNASLFALQPGSSSGDTSVVNAWNRKNNYGDQGWGNIKIYYSGNFFGKPNAIPFNQDDTNRTTSPLAGRVGLGDSDEREPVYSFTYYCTAGDKSKVSLTEPTADSSDYYEVRYSIIIDGQHGGYPDDGRAFINKDKFIVYGGVMQAWRIKSGNRQEIRDKTDKNTNPSDISGTRPYGLNDDPECAPPDSMTGKMDIKNYNKLPAAEKSKFAEAVAAAGSGGGGSSSDGTGGSSTNCAGGPMGWLFCPLINYLAKGTQLMAQLSDNLLRVKFLSSQGGGEAIEQVWRAVLSIANILLVIAFLFIIFSQSTSVGLSNYGIKRMLPRLIIAAILMNLSFYICAVAIDISNIAGASVMGFLLGAGNTIGTSITSATGGSGGFLTAASGVLAGVGLVVLAFFLLTPILLGMLVFIIALIGRQVILLVLVLVSPLAFVAWLLPNTEKYFKKWSELFLQLLILYPLVMAIFGASLLLSNLIGGDAVGDVNLTGGF